MTGFLESRLGRVAQWGAGAVLVTLLAVAIGRLVPTQPGYGVVAALLVLTIGIAAFEPAIIPLLTMPMLLWGGRIGGGAVDLSVSDAVLFVATLAAITFTPRPFSPALRSLLWLSALYQFATLFTVIANPFTANAVEWVHAWMLVSGALIVGWTVGRSGHARAGLTLFLLAALVLAGAALTQGALQYAQGNFAPLFPSWPFQMHKNYAGTLFGFAAAVAYARPDWMGWSRRWALGAFWLLSAALLITQSRQAIMGLGAAVLLIALRKGQYRERSKLIVLTLVPALAFVGTLVRDEIEEGSQHSPVFQRLTWFEETIDFWRESPWVGHGLRFWYSGDGLLFQPPNAELEVLASTGVVGLAAFAALMIGSMIVLWRLDPVFGTMAVAVLGSRLVQSQFDLFWASAQASIPFAIVGVCLGAAALAEESASAERTRAQLDLVTT